ncbi:hypothetical protein TWF718_004370 [Orbilia javanica]|uniref:SET domain-containing protein n=1 Tax=Orbilia javanica TaxID=47235 RepID=A0AAN8N763_9PEZI
MGIDAGFDIVPKLTKSPQDQASWNIFLSKLRDQYTSDPTVEFKENYMVWKKGEHPMIPYSGHKFLRFSSKVSGGSDDLWEDVKVVIGLAQEVFGNKRVKVWHEGAVEDYFYKWPEVLQSWKSYDEPDVEPEETNPLFIIQNIPNKGRGLVAAVDIEPGTQIIAEKPLFTLSGPSIEALEGPISKILQTLPYKKQDQYRALHNNHKSNNIPPLAGIFKTNALPCGCDSHIGGIYLTICLLNHSCLPNAHHSWNAKSESETIYAVLPIKAGEEITISYTSENQSKNRQKKLKESFGFDCKCSLCTSPPRKIKQSDRRRTEIAALDKSIASDGTIFSDPLACLKDCRRLIKLLNEEYGGCAPTLEGRAYYDAFQVCIAHGDKARASIMARRGYILRRLCEGDGSESTEELWRLIEEPGQHRLFGMSMGWKSEVNDIPLGLDLDGAEKWLWRCN